MTQLRLSIDDLTEQLRSSGYFNLDEILYAIVETNGKLSIYPKFDNRPVTNKDMENKLQECENPSVILISDGQINYESLNFCKLSEGWLNEKLNFLKLKKEDIFIMTSNEDGKIFVVERS